VLPLWEQLPYTSRGQPEITWYGYQYLDASSPRRKQIEKHPATDHQHGAAASQIVARRTRDAKLDLSHDEVQQHLA
jgi:hypothetical protein